MTGEAYEEPVHTPAATPALSSRIPALLVPPAEPWLLLDVLLGGWAVGVES